MADEGTTPESDETPEAPAAGEAPTTDPPGEPPAPESAPVAEEAFALLGHKLDEMGGVQVGKIEGKATGRMEWLVARMGRFGHYCLVPGRDAVTSNGRVWVPYSRDQIRRAPRVEPKAPLAHETEQAVLDHYGLS